MATVSSALSSDQITSLIQQASTAFEAPANTLQAQEKPIETEISALGSVQSALASLQSSLTTLDNLGGLSQRSVSVSPSGAVQATATNATAVGTYSLTNIHLAQAENLVSSGFASTSGAFGAGTIAIQTSGGTAVTVTVPSGQDTLAGIAAAINQADTGVSATVIYDGSTFHLALTADATGTANSFTVSGTGGLSSFTFGAGASGLTATETAANASFSLNGIAITSGSNSVTGVVPGLTLTLAASGAAQIAVSQNVSALVQAAQGVAAALNTALSTISQYSSYTTASGGGPLIGDVGLQIVRTDLLNAVTSPVGFGLSSTGQFNSLSSIGFSVTSAGTVTLDTATLQSAAQTNYNVVAGLLGNLGTATNPNVSVQSTGAAQAGTYAIDVTSNGASGIVGTVNGEAASGSAGVLTVSGAGPAQGLALQISSGVTGDLGSVTLNQGLFGQLTSILNGALGSSGSVNQEINSLNASIASMNTQIAALQKQALQQTQALTQQYATAQATISQLTTVSDFLSTYFNQTSG